MDKDTSDSETESLLNLTDAYLHLIFHSFENEQAEVVTEEEVELPQVKADKSNHTHTDIETHSPSPVADDPSSPPPPHYVYHYQS